MKTWIENHQILATVIALAIIAGLIYLFKFLSNKYGNKTVTPKVNPVTPVNPSPSPTGIMPSNPITMGVNGSTPTSMAGAGMRVGVGGGAKH